MEDIQYVWTCSSTLSQVSCYNFAKLTLCSALVNRVDVDNRTALFYAQNSQRKKCVLSMMKGGVDLSVKDVIGETV